MDGRAGRDGDEPNRLLEDDSFCYAYDDNGNLESKTAKVASVCTGGVTGYTYDAEDRLVRIDFPDLSFAGYRYDGLGRGRGPVKARVNCAHLTMFNF